MFESLEKTVSYSMPSLGMSCFLKILNITIPRHYFFSLPFRCPFLMLIGMIPLWIEDTAFCAVITDEQIAKTGHRTFYS